MKRIAITGPESTGKTTITKQLAEHFQVKWFPEYAREYLTENGPMYERSDLLIIAKEQEKRRRENEQNDQVAFYDTENIVIKVWSDFKYKTIDPKLIDLVKNQEFDYYFLSDPKGMKWEHDPLRENPLGRRTLFELYKKELEDHHYPYTVLSGNRSERIEKAINITEDILLSGGGFCV